MHGEGEDRSFYEIMDATTAWNTFDRSLTRACLDGLIEDDVALLYATNRNKLTRMLDDGRKQAGQQKPMAAPAGTGLRLSA